MNGSGKIKQYMLMISRFVPFPVFLISYKHIFKNKIEDWKHFLEKNLTLSKRDGINFNSSSHYILILIQVCITL